MVEVCTVAGRERGPSYFFRIGMDPILGCLPFKLDFLIVLGDQVRRTSFTSFVCSCSSALQPPSNDAVKVTWARDGRKDRKYVGAVLTCQNNILHRRSLLS